jgi:hypothetical protein
MKATLQNAVEIENQGGAILASAWTNGRGNYITRRPIPAYCAEVVIRSGSYEFETELKKLTGKTKATARRLAKAHPKAQKLIVVADRRGLNRAVKGAAK